MINIKNPSHYDQIRAFASHCVGAGALPRFDDDGRRLDVEGATAFLARELQAISAQNYNVLYNPIKARQLFPFVGGIPLGADSWAYDQIETFGEVVAIDDIGLVQDLPNVELVKQRLSFNLRSFASSYTYTVQDVRRSQMAGTLSLPAEKARTARDLIDRKIDSLAAFGDAATGMKGVIGTSGNATDFKHGSDPTPWSTSTVSDALIADGQYLIDTIRVQSAENFSTGKIVFPLSSLPLWNKPYSTTSQGTTRLQILKANNPGVDISFWNLLDNAKSGFGTYGRALAFSSDPRVLAFRYATDYEEFPENESPRAFKTVCHARALGVTVHYQLGTLYIDV